MYPPCGGVVALGLLVARPSPAGDLGGVVALPAGVIGEAWRLAGRWGRRCRDSSMP